MYAKYLLTLLPQPKSPQNCYLYVKKSAIILFILFFAAGIKQAEGQTTKSAVIVNSTGKTVYAVYLCVSGTKKWGNNILANKLADNRAYNYTQQITDTAQCEIDLKYVIDNNKEFIIHSIDLCSTTQIILSKPPENIK